MTADKSDLKEGTADARPGRVLLLQVDDLHDDPVLDPVLIVAGSLDLACGFCGTATWPGTMPIISAGAWPMLVMQSPEPLYPLFRGCLTGWFWSGQNLLCWLAGSRWEPFSLADRISTC